MEGVFIVLLSFVAAYALFLLWCLSGWDLTNTFQGRNNEFKTKVTVVVVARNEERNIENCLNDLIAQNYPSGLSEIILVDDDSHDRTYEIAESIRIHYPDKNLKIIRCEKHDQVLYKKQAITQAIKIATGELIAITDADCRMGNNWLSTIAAYYVEHSPELISAPVVMHGEKGFLQRLQSLEFMGLIGIGAASITNRVPIMCNGANLAYPKKIFEELNGFEEENNSASGDDTQLMQKIAGRNKRAIHFLKSRDAIVYTLPEKTISSLYNQRIRWASKIPVNMSFFSIAIAAITYLLHLGLIATLLFSFNSAIALGDFLILILIKSIAEFLFLSSVASFFKREKLLWLFLPAQVFYMFYIVIIGLIAPFSSYTWKGRKAR